jgi:AraC-like DNA-binding protein
MTLAVQPHNLKDVRVRTHLWGGLEVHALQLQVLPGRAWHQLSGDLPALSVVVRESGGCCEARATLEETTDSARGGIRRRMGHTSLIPARASFWGYTEDIDCVEEVRLMLDPARLEEILGYEFPMARLTEPALMFFDEPMQVLAGLIAFNEQQMQSHALLGDSLVTAMVARLASLGAMQPQAAHRRLGLSPAQISAVRAYILDNLASPIRLAELSALAGLSPSQFGRAFKVTTGKTPHQWTLDARIERAIAMLADPRNRLAEIALQTGFSEQSHFTRSFSAATGTSPNRWRRAQYH